jgi:hypothetical protein
MNWGVGGGGIKNPPHSNTTGGKPDKASGAGVSDKKR